MKYSFGSREKFVRTILITPHTLHTYNNKLRLCTQLYDLSYIHRVASINRAEKTHHCSRPLRVVARFKRGVPSRALDRTPFLNRRTANDVEEDVFIRPIGRVVERNRFRAIASVRQPLKRIS